MADTQPNLEPTDKPFPPRFWWLKRILLASILFVAGVFALRWYATESAKNRLLADIAARRAHGEKLLPADFNEPAIPDSQNAAVDLKRAIELISPSYENWETEGKVGPIFPMGTADQQFMARFIVAHREGYACVRRARGKSAANWGVRFSTPMIGSTDFRQFNGQKNVAWWVYLALAQSHAAGNDAAAIEYARDILMLARVCEQPPSMVSHLGALGIAGLAADAVTKMATTLSTVQGAGNPSLAGPAGSDQVNALIADLLDEKAEQEGYVAAYAWERAESVDMLSWANSAQDHSALGLVVGNRDAGWAVYAMPSLLYHEAREVLDGSEQWMLIAQCRDLRSAKNRIGPLAPPSRQGSPFSSILSPPFIQFATAHFRGLQARRKAAVLLAEELWFAETGHRLMQPKDLLPEYLPAVLDDPLNGNNSKLGLHGNPTPSSPPKK